MKPLPTSLLVARQRTLTARDDLRIAVTEVRKGASPRRLKSETSTAIKLRVDRTKAVLCTQIETHPVLSCAVAAGVTGVLVYWLKQPVAEIASTTTRTVRNFCGRIRRGRKIA